MPASQARKARRALERGEAAPVKPSKVSTPSKKRKPAGTSQDADKAAGSAKQPSGGETAGDATETDDASVKTGQKRVATTLFIGQLPYQASAKDIEKHFSQAACGGAVKVRLLTKRDSNASKGMAFVEMGSEAAVHSALRLHHSCIFGRRINVERTVGGGGNDEARKQKLQSLRECQGKQMLKSARELVERILPAGGEAGEDADDEVPGATLDDVDDRLLEFVTSIQPAVAEGALEECAKIDFTGVKKRKAYLMGVLKRKVADSDYFGKEKFSYGGVGAGGGGSGGSGAKRKELPNEHDSGEWAPKRQAQDESKGTAGNKVAKDGGKTKDGGKAKEGGKTKDGSKMKKTSKKGPAADGEPKAAKKQKGSKPKLEGDEAVNMIDL